MENYDRIIKDLELTGSNIEELKEIRETVKRNSDANKDLDTIMFELKENIKDITSKFYNGKNNFGIKYMTGFTSSIYIPSFDSSGEIKILLNGGETGRVSNKIEVNKDTLFDTASITKLFTLILVFKLEELGLINLNDKIKDLDPDFNGMEDFTFNDLIRLHGEILTDGNITLAHNEKDAYQILKTAYLKSNTRETNKYTDFGAIIIGKTIEHILSKKYNKDVTLEELMHKYIFSESNMNNTLFNPKGLNISGNGGYDTLVHDPKARILGGAVGSAGIFTTSDDLNKLAKNLYSVNYINPKLINKEHLDRLGEVTFKDGREPQKGNLGIYVKHPLGYEKTFTPSLFSTGSFSHQGWTGSVALFDPNNLIHHNFLTNTIYKTDNKDEIRADKPIGFGNAWDIYEKEIIKKIMIMMITKKYFNLYKDREVNINDEIKIK